MSWEIWLPAVFFVLVMVSIVIAGHVFLNRSEKAKDKAPGNVPNGLSLEDAPLPSTQAMLSRALHFMGESMPTSGRGNQSHHRRFKFHRRP